MNDITALAQGKSLRKKLNRRMNDALGFRRISGGKHDTISLSIDECKSVIAALDERLALVEALEKAQRRIAELEGSLGVLEEVCISAADEVSELESRTVTVRLPEYRNSPDMHTKQYYEAIGFNQGLDGCVEALTAAGIQVIE